MTHQPRFEPDYTRLGCEYVILKKREFFSRFLGTKHKPVKKYYIYFHDAVLGGPCYLKISSYLPFPCEFYFNGHNYIKFQLYKRGVSYKMKENAFTAVSDPEVLNQLAREIDGKLVQQRIDYWMNLFFKFDKGKYATRSRHLKHDWYLSQVEVCTCHRWKYVPMLFLDQPNFAPVSLKNFWINSCVSDCPTPLPKYSPGGLPRSHSKSFWRLYDNNACIKHWFK